MAKQVQPPSGGCVLKPGAKVFTVSIACQPPSGGCVLKHRTNLSRNFTQTPAAFGRLCVETSTDTATKGKGNASRLRAAVC